MFAVNMHLDKGERGSKRKCCNTKLSLLQWQNHVLTGAGTTAVLMQKDHMPYWHPPHPLRLCFMHIALFQYSENATMQGTK